jgi:hypothetical protein
MSGSRQMAKVIAGPWVQATLGCGLEQHPCKVLSLRLEYRCGKYRQASAIAILPALSLHLWFCPKHTVGQVEARAHDESYRHVGTNGDPSGW